MKGFPITSLLSLLRLCPREFREKPLHSVGNLLGKQSAAQQAINTSPLTIAALQARIFELETQLQTQALPTQQLPLQPHPAASATFHSTLTNCNTDSTPLALEQVMAGAIAAISCFRVWDNQTWVCVYRSPGCATVFGFSPQQLLADPHLWLTHTFQADWATHLQPILHQPAALQTTHVEYRFHHPNGSLRWIAGTYHTQPEASNQSWLVTAVELDITQRKQQEIHQQTNEEKLRLAIDLNQIGIWDWNLATNQVTWNDNNRQLLGLAPGGAEPSYELWRSCIHPDDRAEAENVLQQALHHHQPFRLEHRVSWPDGSIHWLLSRARMLVDEAGQPIRMIGVVSDISARKHTEQALANLNQELNQRVEARTQELEASQAILRQSEARFQRLAANLPSVIYQFKMSADGTRSFPYVSAGVQDLCGVAPEAIQHNPAILFDACEAGDRATLETSLAHSLATLEAWTWEGRFLKPSGEIVWLQCASNPERLPNGDIVWDGIAIDVTERKAVEIAIRQSEETFRKLFEAAPIAIGIVRVDTLQVLKVNPAYVETFGYSQEELQSMTLTDYTHPDDLDIDLEHINGLLAGYISKFRLEKRYIRKNGEILWGKLTATLTSGWGEDIPCCMGMIEDITAAKQLQLQRENAEMILQQQAQRERLLRRMTQHIHESLDAHQILQVAVEEVRALIHAERVAVYRFNPDWSGSFVTEAVTAGWTPLVGFDEQQKVWKDTHLQSTQGGRYQRRESFAIADIYTAGHQDCHIALLEQFQARAYMIAPIFNGETLWGLLAAYQNSAPREWQAWEIELLCQIADQLAIAIQQADLYQQVQDKLAERIQTQGQLTASLLEKEILLKEVHHRVKNNLQIVSSLLRMQSRQIAEPGTSILFQEAQNRVQSMASIHEQFYQSPDLAQIDFKDYVRTLATNLFHSYGISQQQIGLSIAVEDISLTLDTAIPCGLIINELISNALKYAFPNHRTGKITIYLSSLHNKHSTNYDQGILIISDDGIGISDTVDWETTPSLGLRIVRNLVEQIKGTLAVNRDRGTTFQLIFPIATLERSPTA